MLFGYFSALIINGGIVYAENNVFFSAKYRPDHKFFSANKRKLLQLCVLVC